MISVTASCPGHISGYFRRITGNTTAIQGSIGAGIVINPGVIVTVTASKRTSISIRQKCADRRIRQISDRSPPVESALRKIGTDAAIITECTLPIGAGFGLSAAALLATLTAVNRLENLGLHQHDIAGIAHETEVEHRTGLGDVSACQDGGRVVRRGAGIDGEINRYFDVPGPIYAVSFGPISTPSVLGSKEQMERVTRAFPDSEPLTADEFFLRSRDFSNRSGLVTGNVDRVLRTCEAEGVSASMTMLGNGVFAHGKKAYAVLRSFGEVYTCEIARGGARIVEVRS